MKKGKWALVLVVLLIVSTLFVACSNASNEEATSEEGQENTETANEEVENSEYPKNAMEFLAPAGAGGGWDLTIRTVAKVLEDTGIVSVPMPVTNKEGGGGGVNLAYMQDKAGDDNVISVYSPPLLLINLNGSTDLSFEDTTPIAKLITDYGAFVVPKDSPYETINEVMDALKEDPKSVKIGGASSAGSMDHVQFLIVAQAAGVENINEIDYIAFQDGTATSQVLGGHVDLLSAGLADVEGLLESGDLKAIGQTADKRIGEGALAEVPTVKEQGIDVLFENWRGLFGAPDMPDYAVEFWKDALTQMVETEDWKEACSRNGWDEAFQVGEDFQQFLVNKNEEYKGILEEIGMLD